MRHSPRKMSMSTSSVCIGKVVCNSWYVREHTNAPNPQDHLGPLLHAHDVWPDPPVGAPSDAFKPAPGRRASRAGSGTTQSERGGWHTFCKGDMVTLTTGGDKKPLEPRESAHAFVYGVTYHENEKGHGRKQQGRKILVLYEDPSQVFFLAYPTRWKRMPRGGARGISIRTSWAQPLRRCQARSACR